MAPIAAETLISPNTTVLACDVGGETVMMHIDRGRYFGLNGIASDIWRRMETECSFAALVDQLALDYAADRTTIEEDVRELLEQMAAEEVVRLT